MYTKQYENYLIWAIMDKQSSYQYISNVRRGLCTGGDWPHNKMTHIHIRIYIFPAKK